MTATLAHQPPNNAEAQAAILACLLLDPGLMPAIATRLRPDDFYGRVHANVYDAMLALHLDGKRPDPVLVVAELQRRDRYEGPDSLAAIVSTVSDPANATHYADLILDLAKKREHYYAAQDLLAASLNGHAGTDLDEKAATAAERIRAMFAPPATDSLFGTVSMTDTDQTPWLVRGYLARRAVTLLSAHPKAGKSTLAYAIVAALQRGDPAFLGLAIPSPGLDTLVLSEEDDAVLAETFRSLNVDATRVRAITRQKAFPRRPLSQIIDAAISVVQKSPSIALVIVDTWRFWAQLPDKGSNDADTVGKAFSEIARLAASGVAVLLLHHARKADGEEGNAASGSNALTGSADILLELRRFGKDTESNSMRTIKAYGRFQRIPDELVIDKRGPDYIACGDASDARDNAADNRIASCLVHSARWLTTDEIENAIGMKASAVTKGLSRLYGKKAIQRVGKGSRGSAYLYASLDVPLHARLPENA